MALPIYLQSAIDTAKAGVIWAGIACIAVLCAKAAFEMFLRRKREERKAKQRDEDAAIRKEDADFRKRSGRR